MTVVDEEGRRVELTRDVMGRVIKEKSPGEKEVYYQWGGEGCATCGDGLCTGVIFYELIGV
ncbi:MAG: hypothetical protein JXO51_05255 [Candidatus Aminicenantes bacterium]|nr:hypothetical protein [Candidatus Aminicenantes bacterium]